MVVKLSFFHLHFDDFSNSSFQYSINSIQLTNQSFFFFFVCFSFSFFSKILFNLIFLKKTFYLLCACMCVRVVVKCDNFLYVFKKNVNKNYKLFSESTTSHNYVSRYVNLFFVLFRFLPLFCFFFLLFCFDQNKHKSYINCFLIHHFEID